MKLIFTVGQQVINFYVNKKREMFFSSSLTNDEKVPFRNIVNNKVNSKEDIELTEAIIKDIKKETHLEQYIINECKREGLVHVKTIL